VIPAHCARCGATAGIDVYPGDLIVNADLIVVFCHGCGEISFLQQHDAARCPECAADVDNDVSDCLKEAV
jgi:hypothetical protein